MVNRNDQKAKSHYLFPGTIFAHRQPHLVTTVLGSCVAVCIWHPQAQVGGINHYLLPLWNGEGLPTPKYGNIAITRLVEKVRSLAGDGELIAKVFGGASMWFLSDQALSVGQLKVELAFDLLAEQKIKIVSQDVWGELGRKIIFDTGTGKVLLRRNQGVANRTALKTKPRS